MAKEIRITNGDKEYILTFTRKSIETMEKKGFKASDLTDYPMSVLPALFAGAFIAKHPFVKKDVVDAIFDHIKNKAELINKLSEMYNEPILAMLDEPEDDEGEWNWEADK